MNRLDELSIADRLKYMATNSIKDIGNRALTAAGSNKARGRLILSRGTAKLYNGWREYVGREEAAGNKDIENNPTVSDLVNYLDTAYSLNMSAESIEKIMNTGQPSEQPSEQHSEQPSEDDVNKIKKILYDHFPPGSGKSLKLEDASLNYMNKKTTIDIEKIKLIIKHLLDIGFLVKNSRGYYFVKQNTNESISRKEFEFFKNMFNSNALYEDVVLLEKAEFDPRTLFPKIANILIKKGIMTVELGDGKGPSSGGNSNKTFGVDANSMKMKLEKFNLTPENIAQIKNKDLKYTYEKVRDDPVTLKTVIGLVYALSKSWSDKIDSTKNITASGNTIDMSILIKSLSEHLNGDFKSLEIIKRATDGDRSKAISNMGEIIKAKSERSRMFCDIAYAVAQAITKA